jgi:hypothetical protein
VLVVLERQAHARPGGVGRHAQLGDRGRGLLLGRGLEAHRLAARADRGQDLAQAVGQQDEMHVGRRLLQGLEHPVGGFVAQLVSPLDHEHATAGLKGCLAGGGDHGPGDVGDEDLVRPTGDHPGQIRVSSRVHAAAGVIGIRGALGQQLGRQSARRRTLARSTGTVKQIGM